MLAYQFILHHFLTVILIASCRVPVKHDCVFGDDLDINEITFVSGVQYNHTLVISS